MAPGRSARSAALATLLAALLLLTWPGPGRPQDPDLIVDTDGCGSIEPGTRNVYHTKDHVIMTLAFGMLIRGIEHPYLHSAQHVRRDADVVVLVQRADSHARLQAEGFNHTGIRFIRAYRDPSIKGESIYPIKFRLYSYSCFIRQ